jgi:hypothetical protein
MSIREQCKQAVLQYADEEMQRNAVLFGEHKEYVIVVLQLFRDEYQKQANAGATEFVTPQHIIDILDQMKPW